MYSTTNRVIHERTKNIPIKQKISTDLKQQEYSLKQHFFDPTKSSPPNEFMLKLKQRVSCYDR